MPDNYPVVPTSDWISSCNPDQVLEFWTHCVKTNKNFDELVELINNRLAGSKKSAARADIKKKCLDIRKGLKNAFDRLADEHKGDPTMMANISLARNNIPANLTGMGNERANYGAMLMTLIPKGSD